MARWTLNGMIRELGFDYVVEAAFGADLVAQKYKELFDNFHGKYYLSSKCPALVNYVEDITTCDYSANYEELTLPAPIKKALILHNGEFTPEYVYMKKFIE